MSQRHATEEDVAAARRLAAEITESSSSRRPWRKVDTLADLFGVQRMTPKARQRIQEALTIAGLEPEPSVLEVSRKDTVRFNMIGGGPAAAPESASASAGDDRALSAADATEPLTSTSASAFGNGTSAGSRRGQGGAALSPEARTRARVEAAGGKLVDPIVSLVELFGFPGVTSEAMNEVRERLGSVGVGMSPAPDGGEGHVLLFLLKRAEEPVRTDGPAPPPESVQPVGAAAVAAGAGFAAIATGVIVTGLVFVVLGLLGHWIYGLLYLAFTVLTLGLLRWRLPWFVRMFLPRFPRLWSLGAVTMLAIGLLASMLVVLPVSLARDVARERDAKAEVARANGAMDSGDLDGAEDHLVRAEDNDNDAPGLDAAERRLEGERAEERKEAENFSAYSSAEEAFDDEEYESAINAMENLGTYRDAPRRAERFRREASTAVLANARSALKRSAPRALELAKDADGYHSTRQTRVFVRRARSTVRVRRARARAVRRLRARRRAAKQRQREIAADQRRIQRQQEQEQQRLREEEQQRQEDLENDPVPAAPPADDGGGGGTGNWCGKRDGDGDGIYCE